MHTTVAEGVALATAIALALTMVTMFLSFLIEKAEQSVLGGILLDSTAMDRIGNLRPEHFTSADHHIIFQAMLDGGPGQHFLGSPHTLANFENAFWRSHLSDNNSFEQWEIDGAQDAAVRANARWKRLLAEYQPPPLDDGVHDELRAWMDSRRASFPDSDV